MMYVLPVCYWLIMQTDKYIPPTLPEWLYSALHLYFLEFEESTAYIPGRCVAVLRRIASDSAAVNKRHCSMNYNHSDPFDS